MPLMASKTNLWLNHNLPIYELRLLCKCGLALVKSKLRYELYRYNYRFASIDAIYIQLHGGIVIINNNERGCLHQMVIYYGGNWDYCSKQLT